MVRPIFRLHRGDRKFTEASSATMNRNDGKAGFELVDHTAEQTLRLRAPSLAGLVEQAALGFASLVPGRLWADSLPGAYEVVLERADPAGTLVAWINDLVYHAEAERWLPVDVRAVSVGEDGSAGSDRAAAAGGIRVEARRRGLVEPFVLVKAATLHDASVRTVPGGSLEIEIVLDI